MVPETSNAQFEPFSKQKISGIDTHVVIYTLSLSMNAYFSPAFLRGSQGGT